MSKRATKAKSVEDVLATVPDASPTEVAARITPPTADDLKAQREAFEQLVAKRNIQRTDAPTEPESFVYTPALGDNTDALAHQTRLAHAATDEERTAILAEIETNRRA